MKLTTDIKSQAITSVKWSGASMMLVSVFQFVTTAILARLLAPQDFGLMGMLTVIIGLAQTLSDGGIGGAIIHRQDTTRDQLSSLYWCNLGIGFLLLMIILLCRPLAVNFFREERLFALLSLVAFIPLIVSTGQQFQVLFQKELRFKTIAIVEVSGIIFWSASTIGLALRGWGVMSLVIGQIVRVTLIAGLWLMLGWKRWHPRMHFRRKDLNGYVSFGLFQTGAAIGHFLRLNIDYLLIGRFLGAEMLGFYTLAYQLVLAPFQKINPVITRVSFPTFAKLQSDDVRLRRWYLKLVTILAFIAMPLYLGLALVSDRLIPALFGASWTPSIQVAQVLCVLAIFYTVGFPVDSLMLAKGRADLGFKSMLIVVALQFVANAVGLSGGIVGVGVSTLVLAALLFFSAGFILRWLVVRMHVKEFLISLQSPLIASGSMVAVLIALRIVWPDIPLVLQILAGAVTYFIVYLFISQEFLLEMLALARHRMPREAS